MLMEVDRPPGADPSGRQLALPLMPLAPTRAAPVSARPEAVPPEGVWPALGPVARAAVRRAFVAVLQEGRRDRGRG
jgi:hypothetical protein